MTDPEQTAVRAFCYTDNNGKPCGEAAVAHLSICPAGPPVAPVGQIPICMSHLVKLMFRNGVGPDERSGVVDSLTWHMARGIAAEMSGETPAPPRPAGRARPILSNVNNPEDRA